MIKKQSKTEIVATNSAQIEEVAKSAPEDFIGQRIFERRKVKDLNHDGLARLTKLLDRHEGKGINRTTIRGYEVGMYKPGARELRLLSEALEVSPAWLLLGTGDIAPVLDADLQKASERRYSEFEKLVRVVFLLPWIDKKSRDTVYDLIITMARMSLGEEKFRGEDAMLKELASMIGDYMEDHKKDKTLPDMEKMKPLMEKYMEMAVNRFNQFTESE